MKKKLLTLALSALLALQALPAAAFAGYENFTLSAARVAAFADVPADAWYAGSVQTAYSYGLIDGKTDGVFDPDGSLTLAEAVKLAACLHRVYAEGTAVFAPSAPWYQTYVDYARQAGVLTADYADFDAFATRADFAMLFAAALPADALEAVGDVEDGAIPDVSASDAYADAVYRLYRAGVLTGADTAGRFLPQSGIRRSEVAAIVARMADPALREVVTLHTLHALSASEAETQCMPAVVKLYLYNKSGSLTGYGSGVLLSADGDLATAAHCVNGVYRVVAELADGRRCEAAGIYDIDTAADVARLRLEGQDFPYLPLNDDPAAGSAVYVLGYPGGGSAKLTAGTLLDTNSRQGTVTYLESNAEAHSGNSGGAMIDAYGRLIGVVSAVSTSGSGAERVYAVPVSALANLSADTLLAVSAYTQAHLPAAENCYTGLYPVPDFGKALGIPLFASEQRFGGISFYYRLADLGLMPESMIYRYYERLNANTFYRFSGESLTSSSGYPYSVTLEQKNYRGTQTLAITVKRLAGVPIGGLPQAAGFLFLQEILQTPAAIA